MICVLLGCISYTNIGTGHISVLAAERSNIVTQDFNYTGGGQSFTAPATAVYTFKLYGAGGGGENPDWVKDQLISAYDTSTDGGYTRRGIPYVYHDKVTGNYGGKGGYTEVKLSLTAGQTIYIYVGGTGTGMLWESFADGYQAGGYNGGGSAVHSGCSGGGATHIATTDRGTLDNYAAYQSEVLAVAGGGGGADNITDDGTCSPVHSGNGGGADGTAGDVFNDEESRVYPGQGGIAGTTTGGYAFGKGENAAGVDDAGGGGGGWYGGYSGNISSYGRYNNNSAGGGGSGYVNTTSPYYSGTVSQQAGINWGNGKVTVSYELATTVTFDLQGGKVDGSTTNPVRTMRAGTSDNNTQDWMTTSRMAKTGYMFAGFYTGTNGTGTKVYDIYSGGVNCVKNTDYWDDSGNWKYSGSTLTLYAYWLSNQCTMTVNYRKWNPNTNAWDIYDTKTEKVDYGTTYSPVAGTAPTGYVFDSKTADYTVAADKTFNVNFKPKQTTVTYYRNYSSADTTTASQTFTYAKTGETLTDQSWSRTGYNILGWADSRTATAADYSLTNPVSDEWKNTYYPSVSLYAVWQAQEYSITYDLAGGTASGNPASYTVETPTFTLNNPTRTYYRFDGWSGTGITGLSTSVTISKGSVGNRQYTAHWTDITPPTVMPSPASIQWCRNTNLTINWLDYGDGLADNTGRNYFYFMSADGTKTSNYAYTPDAASNVGADLNGTYYLYIHEIKDKEGNVSLFGGAKTGVYHKFGPYKFDNICPVITMTSSLGDTPGTISFTINGYDIGDDASGLADTNNYRYYLSDSPSSLSGGSWKNYTPGVPFSEGEGIDASKKWYLFVKRVYDKAGNASEQEGKLVEVNGEILHTWGEIVFDNTPPTGNAVYTETFETLGIPLEQYNVEPNAIISIDNLTDDVSGVKDVVLIIYDKADESNKAEFAFEATDDDSYICNFNMYGCLTDYADIATVGMKIIATDNAGNAGLIPIDDTEWGLDALGIKKLNSDIHFVKDTGSDIYYRDSFRIEARLVNWAEETTMLGGQLCRLRIYTFGCVESVKAYLPTISTFIRYEYDEYIELPLTNISKINREKYVHEFILPLYTAKGYYADNVAYGYKKGIEQDEYVGATIVGNILEEIRTILNYNK